MCLSMSDATRRRSRANDASENLGGMKRIEAARIMYMCLMTRVACTHGACASQHALQHNCSSPYHVMNVHDDHRVTIQTVWSQW